MLAQDRSVAVSKKLSLVLRHDPASVGVTPDANGWVEVDALLEALNRNGFDVKGDEIAEVVRTSDKQRFVLADGKIRANQGHSIQVDLGLEAAPPPDLLFHGTVYRFLDSIYANGLTKGERHHVHLSADLVTAQEVGKRRGVPVVLIVDAARMAADGHVFFRSDNGVWLTDHVPARYVSPVRP